LRGKGGIFFIMKKFIKAFREYKDLTDTLNRKLVYDPKNNNWLVTSFFTKKFINYMGLEVVYNG